VVVLVCRRWREVGEAPGLWLWVSLVAGEGSLAAMPAMLDSRRLSRKTCLEARVVSEELLRAMARHPALRSVDMGHPSCALARQETGLLVAAVTRLETVDLRRAGMSAGQVAGLAGALAEGCTLASINLSGADLSAVTPAVLAAAASTLVKLDLSSTALTEEQVAAMFDILQPGGRLKRLNLANVNLSAVAAGALAATIATVVDAGLEETMLTPQQAAAVCAAIAAGSSIRSIEFGSNFLGGLPAATLAAAVAGLEEVGLSWCGLSTLQLGAVMAAVTEDCRLASLMLDGNTELAGMDRELLARAVNKLKVVSMKDCRVGVSQVTSILKQATNLTKLEEVAFGTVVCQDWNEDWVRGLVKDARKVVGNVEVEVAVLDELDSLDFSASDSDSD